MSTQSQIYTNAAWDKTKARPKDQMIISILIPFYHDNPVRLLHELGDQAPKGTELIFYDDGSADEALNALMVEKITQISIPVQLICAHQNHGRSYARNALVKASRGQWVLLLDADMMPPNPQFLPDWHACIARQKPAIAFGGFKVEAREDVAPAMVLHQAFSQTSDCLNAQTRTHNPAKHVCTSNLLVRRDVLQACPFDNGFCGWGWEDVEWAARAADEFPIIHIDNPAIHLGLENADTLLQRFRDSAGNYARFVARHPDLARTLPSWQSANIIRKIPGFSRLRPIFSAIARNNAVFIPLRLRTLALKLWRSSWYAEALS